MPPSTTLTLATSGDDSELDLCKHTLADYAGGKGNDLNNAHGSVKSVLRE